MIYFRERRGVYRASALVGRERRASRFLPLLFLLSMVPLFILMISTSQDYPQRSAILIALVIMGASFFFSLAVSIARYGAGISVNQLDGTITFRAPGQSRRRVPLSSLQKVLLIKLGGYASALFLLETGGKRHYLMLSKKHDALRIYADELASLTCLRLSEEERSGNSPGLF